VLYLRVLLVWFVVVVLVVGGAADRVLYPSDATRRPFSSASARRL
jgi:hypothetical protein